MHILRIQRQSKAPGCALHPPKTDSQADAFYETSGLRQNLEPSAGKAQAIRPGAAPTPFLRFLSFHTAHRHRHQHPRHRPKWFLPAPGVGRRCQRRPKKSILDVESPGCCTGLFWQGSRSISMLEHQPTTRASSKDMVKQMVLIFLWLGVTNVHS